MELLHVVDVRLASTAVNASAYTLAFAALCGVSPGGVLLTVDSMPAASVGEGASRNVGRRLSSESWADRSRLTARISPSRLEAVRVARLLASDATAAALGAALGVAAAYVHHVRPTVHIEAASVRTTGEPRQPTPPYMLE